MAGLWLALALLAGEPAAARPGPTDNHQGIPVSLTFLDPRRGFLLVIAESHVDLYGTSDGGESWKRLSERICAATDFRSDEVRRVYFADPQHGWIFGPRLFSTVDGGVTWKEEHPGGEVWGLDSSGGTAWALVVGQTKEYGRMPPRPAAVVEARIGSSEWRVLAELPSLVPIDNGEGLRRIEQREAWILQYSDDTPAPVRGAYLLRTTDAGKTCETVADPCPHGIPPFELGSDPGQPRRLWMLCTSGAADGADVSVARSLDGGARWTPSKESFSWGVDSFAVASSSEVWRTGGRYGGLLSSSDDGGSTWAAALMDSGDDHGKGFRSVFFLDASHGWVTSLQWLESSVTRVDVLRTSDGGEHWTAYPLVPEAGRGTAPARITRLHLPPYIPPTAVPEPAPVCSAAARPSEKWVQEREQILARGRKNLDAYLAQGGLTPTPKPDEPMGVLQGADWDGMNVLRGCIAIKNMWRELSGEQILSVYAGTDPRDSSQGLLVVTRRSVRSGFLAAPAEFISPPEGAGALSIEDASGTRLRIATKDGRSLFFDVLSRRWIPE
jgi:photosystem II stability/assembly factor-like uncharacterized protein